MKKVALITGASRGIGRGIALELARLGWDLALNFNSNAGAAAEAQSLCDQEAKAAGFEIRAAIFQANIALSEERERLVHSVQQKFDRVELLVNNAGIAPKVRADILDASEESFDELIQVNVKAPYFLTQGIARWMITSREKFGPEYKPKIITITSISAYTASINRGDYCIAKAALSMLTPLYASRLAEHGINVYEIRPGIIATDMTSGVKSKYDELIAQGLTPIKRWGQPSDIGKAVAAIAQDLLPFSTGEIINVDGGFHLHRL